MQDERYSAIECILFVSGEPVSLVQLQRALDITGIEMNAIIHNMEKQYRQEERGIQLYITDDTVQLVSNKKYASYVEELLQPAQTKSFTQAMLETLSIVAYKQPVTRADIEAVRGVRCDYSVSQLLKLGPMMFGTTDAFLRQFGLHSIEELPEYGAFAIEADGGEEKPS